MQNIHLFTDGSVNTQSNVGYGAYLLVEDLAAAPYLLPSRIQLRRFDATSSTKLELQTWLWAVDALLSQYDPNNLTLTSYTDSQNIIGLPARRARLEERNYTNSKNKTLNYAELYKIFYKLIDCSRCDFVKVDGHKPKAEKNSIDQLFELVDKASRNATRSL